MTPSRPYDSAGRISVPLLVALALALVLIGAGAWYGIDRLQQLEQTVTTLDQQVRRAEERAERARSRAERAEDRAAAAQTHAEEASEQARQRTAEREAAEEARLTAEAEAKVASETATEAERAAAEAERVAAEAERVAAEARAEAERIRQQRDEEMARLQSALGEIAETQRTALGLVMNLGEDAINFEFDRAELKPEDRELLSRIAGVLLTTSEYRIQVFGHTDDVGSAEYNQELSKRRAEAVASYLVKTGVDPDIMTVKGFGKTQPLVDETTEQARARNRRVELGIIDTAVDFTRPATEDDQRQR